MGLLSAIFFGLYAGYNGWSMEQHIRKSLSLEYTEPNLCAYYRHVVMVIGNKFCGCWCKKNKYVQEEQDIEARMREILDVRNMVERLDRLE